MQLTGTYGEEENGVLYLRSACKQEGGECRTPPYLEQPRRYFGSKPIGRCKKFYYLKLLREVTSWDQVAMVFAIQDLVLSQYWLNREIRPQRRF